jgi:hypothetical protein
VVRPDFPGLCVRFPDEKANGVGRLPFRRAVARTTSRRMGERPPFPVDTRPSSTRALRRPSEARNPLNAEHTFAGVRQNAAMQLSGRTAGR